MIYDEKNNYKIHEDSNFLQSIENEQIISVPNKKSKLKKCMHYFLYFLKTAYGKIPNSYIKLPFIFKGKTSYSNWIMKLIAIISLFYLVILTVKLISKVGNILEIKTNYVFH